MNDNGMGGGSARRTEVLGALRLKDLGSRDAPKCRWAIIFLSLHTLGEKWHTPCFTLHVTPFHSNH